MSELVEQEPLEISRLFQALRAAVTNSKTDWSVSTEDAAVYQILVGWDAATFGKLVARHKWNPWIIRDLRKWQGIAERFIKEGE